MSELLLVGSIPFETSKEVFEKFGVPLAAHLRTLPDGEVGPRRHWISRVHYQVLAGHYQLEAVRHPQPENGIERLDPRNSGDSWLFKVRPGVERVTFGEPGWRLGYARDAVNSYFVFQAMKEKGALPQHLRFQVSLPSVNSALPPRVFPDVNDLKKIRPGYTEALKAEVAKIVEKIPARELAIQWDCSTEVQDAYGAVAGFTRETALERNVEQIKALCPAIPAEVELGYHFCFGTLGGWPRFAPEDLSGAVEIANAFVAASGRRVDWVHLPVLDRSDDAFFAPLARLEPQGARVYLGLIHNMERYAARVAAARKFLPNFGVGAYCGLGRHKPSELMSVLQEHLTAARG
jgi:catechol 2,3-dioxygenase-like lactoylglutathione lyase family enzyme